MQSGPTTSVGIRRHILQRLHNRHVLIIECVELAVVPSNHCKQLDYVVARLCTVIVARTFELVLEFGGALIVYECPRIFLIVGKG